MIKTIKLLNEDIEAYVENTGKVKLVFFHGFNSSFKSMLPIIKQENRDFDIATFNFPGCGNSTFNKKITIERYMDISQAFINYLSAKKIVVMGHSLGGMMAASVSNDYRVKNVILLSTFNPYVLDKNSEHKILSHILPTTIQQAKDSYLDLIQNPHKLAYIKNVEAGTKWFFSMVKKVRSRFIYIAKNQLVNKDYINSTVEKVFSEANNLTLGIYGDKDKFSSPSSQIKTYKRFNMEIIKVDNCGHAPMYEYPEIILKAINQVIKNMD